jgi:hypothetical protein
MLDVHNEGPEEARRYAEQDRRKGQEATLNTVCFMDFLVRRMEMKMTYSDDPDFTFENVLFDD